MRDVKKSEKYKDGYYSDLSSFNRIKRSSFVGPNDAVETFKRHREYQPSTGH